MLILGFAGWSGVGKTTLIESAISGLVQQGWSVATIKHAHRRFDMDRPGKDSFRHRDAGARQVLVTSPDRWALLTEHPGTAPPTLADAIGRLDPVDIVLVEGYRGAEIDKIEVWRPDQGGPPLWPDDARIVAVATNANLGDLPAPLADRTLLALDDPAATVAFIHRRLEKTLPSHEEAIR